MPPQDHRNAAAGNADVCGSQKRRSGTTTTRHDPLVQHRAAVRARLAELSLSLGVLDAKIASYAAKVVFAAK